MTGLVLSANVFGALIFGFVAIMILNPDNYPLDVDPVSGEKHYPKAVYDRLITFVGL